jgi:hypothetical protein
LKHKLKKNTWEEGAEARLWPRTCMEGRTITTKSFFQDSHSPNRVSNPGTPEFKCKPLELRLFPPTVSAYEPSGQSPHDMCCMEWRGLPRPTLETLRPLFPRFLYRRPGVTDDCRETSGPWFGAVRGVCCDKLCRSCSLVCGVPWVRCSFVLWNSSIQSRLAIGAL